MTYSPLIVFKDGVNCPKTNSRINSTKEDRDIVIRNILKSVVGGELKMGTYTDFGNIINVKRKTLETIWSCYFTKEEIYNKRGLGRIKKQNFKSKQIVNKIIRIEIEK